MSISRRDRLLGSLRSSFLERLTRLCESLNLTIQQASQLSDSDLSDISTNLWSRLFRPQVSDTRHRHFKLTQPDVIHTHPLVHSRLPRSSASLFHGMRLGSAPLNSFLASIQCSRSHACQCGARETVSHFLLYCPRLRLQRLALRGKLTVILNSRQPLTLKLLLGNPLRLSRSKPSCLSRSV